MASVASRTDLETAVPSPLISPRGDPVGVVHLAAEYYPFARTGGLAEAVSCLASYQQKAGVQVAAIMPLYPTVRDQEPDLEPVGEPFAVQVGPRLEEGRVFRATDPGSGPPVYFIEHLDYFNRPGIYGEGGVDYPDNHRRFAFLSMAAAALLPSVLPGPVILHAHDWHTALAPVYLRTVFAGQPWSADVATVLSVHNPGYQGHFGPEVMPDVGLPWELFNYHQLEWYGKANFLKGGLAFSDHVVTVSPTQAEELMTAEGGFGLQAMFRSLAAAGRLAGVLNGIDQQLWDPARDSMITARYTADELEGKRRCKAALQRSFGLPQRKRVPLLGLTGRMVQQKGLDLILGSPELLALDVQLVFLGTGDRSYEQALLELGTSAPDRIGVQLDFTDRLEHRLMAGADIFLMPSLYEPCGLTQMRAQRYGAPPIGRRVGGLADTIEDDVTGFLFDGYTPAAFQAAAVRALDAFADPDRWRGMMRAGMARDFGWERSVERYLDIYRTTIGAAAPRG